MENNFDLFNKLFLDNKINEIAELKKGLIYLKLRSMSRKEIFEKFFHFLNLVCPNNCKNVFSYVFNLNIEEYYIDNFIKQIYFNERNKRIEKEDKLINELYKLDSFDWGGIFQNNLEKTLVNNYIKKIESYNEIKKCIGNQINKSVDSYVMSSWYNHWTSVIIEDIFKEHLKVLPAIGLVKKIDFFIDSIPFDLKVTYLPEGFVKEWRKNNGYKSELSILKKFAKNNSIFFDKTLSNNILLADLWKKISDISSKDSKILLQELRDVRNNIINEIIVNKKELIKWLYENQGETRFDASNRFFLILVDKYFYFDSWKLKRAIKLLQTSIIKFLDEYESKNKLKINFVWKNNIYSVISDLLIIYK